MMKVFWHGLGYHKSKNEYIKNEGEEEIENKDTPPIPVPIPIPV